MKVKEYFGEQIMEQEREQQEAEEYLYYLTRKALIASGAHLPEELQDVLMFHCGMTDKDLFPNEGDM